MSNEIFDTKTLYVFTNGLNEEQIAEMIFKGVKAYELKYDEKIESLFRINLVRNEENEPLGFAWIYCTNPVLYYLLSNHNVDGTERIELIEQPDYKVPDCTIEEMVEAEYNKEKARHRKDAWILTTMREDIEIQVKRLFEIPTVEMKLAPLIELEPMQLITADTEIDEKDDNEVYYNNELECLAQDISCVRCKRDCFTTKSENAEGLVVICEKCLAKDSELGKSEYLEPSEAKVSKKKVIPLISRGKLSYPENCFVYHELKNTHYTTLPAHLTEKEVYEMFRPYVSDRNTNYPKITFQNKKTANYEVNFVFIGFDPNTADALGAFTMMRKISLVGGEKLAFNFSQQKQAKKYIK